MPPGYRVAMTRPFGDREAAIQSPFWGETKCLARSASFSERGAWSDFAVLYRQHSHRDELVP